MNFYNVNEKHKALLHKAELEAEQNEGELSELIYNELVNSEQNLLEYGESFLVMSKEKTLLSNAIKAEIKEMQARVKKLDEQAEKYISIAVNECGCQAGDRAELILKCTKSVATKIVDEGKISKDYKTTKVVESVNKKAILADLKAGKEVDGCELEEKNNWKLK